MSLYRTSIGALIQALNTQMPANPVPESVMDHVHRIGGHEIYKAITLTANGGAGTNNIFQLTDSVEVFKLYGFITTATTLTNLTAAQFTLWDGAVDKAISKNDGVLSGLAVDTMFLVNAVPTVTMAVADNATGVVTTPAAGVKAFAEFPITQKSGQDTFIRWKYTTTDAPIAAVLTVFCEWRRMGSGLLVPV